MYFWCLQFPQKANENKWTWGKLAHAFKSKHKRLSSWKGEEKEEIFFKRATVNRGTKLKSNFFVLFLRELKTLKRHFEINWPLVPALPAARALALVGCLVVAGGGTIQLWDALLKRSLLSPPPFMSTTFCACFWKHASYTLVSRCRYGCMSNSLLCRRRQRRRRGRGALVWLLTRCAIVTILEYIRRRHTRWVIVPHDTAL